MLASSINPLWLRREELNRHPLAYETKVSTGWPRNSLTLSIPRSVVCESESDSQHSSHGATQFGDPIGIRTRITAVRGQRPYR